MHSSHQATVCLFSEEVDTRPSFGQLLDRLIKHPPPGKWELRLGFYQATENFHYSLGLNCAPGAFPQRHALPEGIERFCWTSREGWTVRAWVSSRSYPNPLSDSRNRFTRLMCHDVPLASDYAILLDDSSYVEAGWWESLVPLLEKGIDYIGQPQWQEYLPDQLEKIQFYPWYTGVPFERRDGRLGVSFMTQGLVAVRSQRLREANFSDLRCPAREDPLRVNGSEVLLGEIARQLGWTQASLTRVRKAGTNIIQIPDGLNDVNHRERGDEAH